MKALSCSTPEPLSAKTKSRINPQANLSLSGEMSRLTKFSDESALTKYRLAVAANGQYTSYHGGTKEGGLSAINTTLTGINFILETDIGVKLELIDNNDEIIYTDSNTDPFEDTIDGNTNAPLQATIDSAIGSANYDIGHLFSGTGGGGNAGAIGAVCNDAYKGSAWSASGQPEPLLVGGDEGGPMIHAWRRSALHGESRCAPASGGAGVTERPRRSSCRRAARWTAARGSGGRRRARARRRWQCSRATAAQ
jgi:hypothetical protein